MGVIGKGEPSEVILRCVGKVSRLGMINERKDVR